MADVADPSYETATSYERTPLYLWKISVTIDTDHNRWKTTSDQPVGVNNVVKPRPQSY